MSTTIKALVAVGLLTFVAACQQEEAVMVEEPVMEEETMSKF
jgi:hypothetical protein